MHTEDQAKKLWCPMGKYRLYIHDDKRINYDSNASQTPLCIASQCMMWRWSFEQTSGGGWVNTHRIGYCGLGVTP